MRTIDLLRLGFRIWALSLIVSAYAQTPADFRVAEGFRVAKVHEEKGLQGFTWDENGVLWTVSSNAQKLVLNRHPKGKRAELAGSISRGANSQGMNFLVHGGKIFLPDQGGIQVLEVQGQNGLKAGQILRPPTTLFPAEMEVKSLWWSGLGYIDFSYVSAGKREKGFGRVKLAGTDWDVVVKGIEGDLSVDRNQFPIATDKESRSIFRVALGLDYERGLETYSKKDLALKLDKEIEPGAVIVYSGSMWPGENVGSWLVFDSGTKALQQFREEEGKLHHWRELVKFSEKDAVIDLQPGPEGGVWLLVKSDTAGALYRLETSEGVTGEMPMELARMATTNLVALLRHPNSWQRDTALRTLSEREELLKARGLHPGTGLHDLFNDKGATAVARVNALLGLHRTGLLDETLLENAVTDPELAVRVWTGLLFGERNYPTGTAFHGVMNLAKETNVIVRGAAAIAARQFVSGSLGTDTPPKIMPIREVWTGGILSTLWFSTEKGSTPEFDLLYWNAVRPITGFDHAHPIGFFNGDNDSKLKIAYWIIGLITRQIAESDDPLKQEEAMLMVGDLKPTNHPMLIAALEGLKKGSGSMRVKPTEKSLQVLEKFTAHENCRVADLGKELAREWKVSARK